jgi:DNA polymerase-3 subunit delta'
VVEAELAAEAKGAGAEEIAAAARLAAGDLELARLLVAERGRQLREDAERCLAAALAGSTAQAPWQALLERAKASGADAEAAAREALEEEAKAGLKRSAREISEEAKRVGRRSRTEVLDLGFALCAAWLRDLAAVAAGAEEVAYARDRLEALREQARGLDSGRARRGAELVQETRRALDLNVSEELALEALFFRLESLLA